MNDDALYRRIFEVAPDAILVAGPDGKILAANEQAHAIFGYAAGTLVGETVETLVPESLRGAHRDHRQDFVDRPRRRFMGQGGDFAARRADGSEFRVEISLSPQATEHGHLVIAAVRDVTARVSAETARRRLAAEAAAQQYRERVAMDMHDNVLQSLAALSLRLIAARSPSASVPTARAVGAEGGLSLDEIATAVSEITRSIRRHIMQISDVPHAADLRAALEGLGADLQAQTGAAVDVRVTDAVAQLKEEQRTAVFYIVQEACHNIRRHARARAVEVRVTAEGDALQIRVADDGVGFDASRPVEGEHFGLRNMRVRADHAGGSLRAESAPGRGTVVVARLPWGSAAP